LVTAAVRQVAGVAEEGVHLGHDSALDDRPGTGTSDVLDGLDQVTPLGDQGVDLSADGLNGR
jgi:hypothetical protein